jgi:ATP-binding cassette subfamily B multidrug efflux pump
VEIEPCSGCSKPLSTPFARTTIRRRDFAGRIASNIVRAAASLRDSVVQIIDALWFVTVFVFSALFIFARTDLRLAGPLLLWIVVYASALSYFVPRIRRRSEVLAHMRATLTGRIVDSYTNIQTVKLFAHLEREDEHAREAIANHTAAFHRQTRLITLLNLTVSVSNSVLLVSVGVVAVWLWAHGSVSLGDIAVSTGLALRVALMSGRVMWTRSASSTTSDRSRRACGRSRARARWSTEPTRARSRCRAAPSGSRTSGSTMARMAA